MEPEKPNQTNQPQKMPVDATGGDHSFKNWFKIMLSNGYIQIFIVAHIIFIIQLFNIRKCISIITDAGEDSRMGFVFGCIGMALPLAITIIVGLKGFLQFWNDLKKGRSR